MVVIFRIKSDFIESQIFIPSAPKLIGYTVNYLPRSSTRSERRPNIFQGVVSLSLSFILAISKHISYVEKTHVREMSVYMKISRICCRWRVYESSVLFAGQLKAAIWPKKESVGEVMFRDNIFKVLCRWRRCESSGMFTGNLKVDIWQKKKENVREMITRDKIFWMFCLWRNVRFQVCSQATKY